MGGKNMNGLLVRVGADSTEVGGRWHGVVDTRDMRFAYVPIPDSHPYRQGMATPYTELPPVLAQFGTQLPDKLAGRNMHRDPDFLYLTYGDARQRAKQLTTHLGHDDLVVFYAALRDIRRAHPLVYALIGLLVVDEIVPLAKIPKARWRENAHSRRQPPADDVVVRGQPGRSGRFERCLSIGGYRDNAWRVTPELLQAWGGLSVHDGYLQRSARLPVFCDAERFQRWLRAQKVALVQRNN